MARCVSFITVICHGFGSRLGCHRQCDCECNSTGANTAPFYLAAGPRGKAGHTELRARLFPEQTRDAGGSSKKSHGNITERASSLPYTIKWVYYYYVLQWSKRIPI